MKIQDIAMQQNINRGKAPSAPVQAKLPVEKNAQLWKAAKGFESMFMGHLLSTMQKSLPEGAAGGEGMVGMMFTQVMGDAMAEGGGIGLAEMLYRELQHNVPAADADKSEGISLKKLVLPNVRKHLDEE